MDWKSFLPPPDRLEKAIVRIQEKKSRLDALRPLPIHALQKIRESLSLEWTYHSNSIEGNTLTLQETKLVIEEGFTVKGKSLREHFDAVNHQEAISYLESLASENYKLSTHDILDCHNLVLQKTAQEFGGRFRNSGVRISGANFIPPNALKVPALMEELIEWVNDERNPPNPLVKATIFHHRFVWIHPFFDGNGRTVRLIFNLLLMKEGFPPAIILKQDRKKYYSALNKANAGDYTKLLLLTVQAVERSLDIYLSSLGNNYEDYQSITDITKEPAVPYGQEYISLLARQGKIDAFKEGRNWLTTKVAVLNYMENRTRKRSNKNMVSSP